MASKEIIFDTLKKEELILLLRAFDYDVDAEDYIVTSEGNRISSEEDPNKFLTIHDAALTPGSLKIIDADPVSISKFIREHSGAQTCAKP